MKEPFRSQALTRLKKAYGHLGRVLKMVEDDKYCIDIIQQNLATIGHLKSVNTMILESHLNTCGGKALSAKSKATREKFIKELVKVCEVAAR